MINLNNVSLLNHQKNNLFFGDSIRYSTRDNYTIQTSLYDLQNTEGSSGILNQLSGISTGAIDYQPIVIRDTYLGLARIDSVNFAQSNMVRIDPVNITFTIFNTGNIFNISGDLYSGIQFDNPLYPVYLIEEFSENFDMQISENGEYTENQKIKVKYVSGAAIGTSLNPISMAQQFISDLLINSNPSIGFIDSFYSGYRQKPGQRLRQESINLITNEYNVSETFKILPSYSGTYAFSYTNSLSLDEGGITTVRELGKSQGLYSNYYDTALSGAKEQALTYSYNRCNSLFSQYNPEYATAYPLNTNRILYKLTLNKYIDTVEYEVTYNNDPRINSSYSWEYTQEIERNDDTCSYNVTENGQVLGLSTQCSPTDKYPNALIAYDTVKAGIESRCLSFYQDFSNFSNDLSLIQKSETRSRSDGYIKYSQTYTDNLLYSYAGARKISIDIEDSYPVPDKNEFAINNYKVIVQPNNLMTLGKRNVNISINGLRNSTLNDYLTLAISNINDNIPSETDAYINDCNYSWKPLKNFFQASCSWVYERELNTNYLIT